MIILDYLARIGHRIAAWPTYRKGLLAFAVVVFLVELAFRRFAPKSQAYARWTKGFEAIGNVWSAVFLSIIYVVSVGPIGLGMRLAGKDPLDRALAPGSAWKTHEPNPLGPRAAARHQI